MAVMSQLKVLFCSFSPLCFLFSHPLQNIQAYTELEERLFIAQAFLEG